MKKKSIQVLVPMSGQGTRYQNAGYKDPKPLIPVNGTPMIERLVEKFPREWKCIFVLADNHRETALESVLKRIRPDSKIIYVPKHASGPAFPLQQSLPDLDADSGILVSYCDYGMIWDPWSFQQFVSNTNCDACLVSYKGFHAHYLSPVPYAYSRMVGNLVDKVKEKGSFTDQRENEFASCGAYYFKNKSVLSKALEYQFKNDIKMNGEFYTSLTVESLLLAEPNSNVRVFEIPYFFQWGTPDDLKDFEYWEKSYLNKNAFESVINKTDQILIPMAGLGSRFKNLTEKKKPFIPIANIKMYEKALESLPKANTVGLVSLKEYAKEIGSKYKFLGLDETPAGQALSVEHGLELLDLKKSVMISACDHGVVIDPQKWQALEKYNFDAIVFCIKGFPGTRRTPKSYSYVETEDSAKNHIFPIVKKIHLKQSITENPQEDYLLVGTFWFRTGEILKSGIDCLKKAKSLVNNELYLDGIFDHLKEKNMTCAVFPLDGYFNWGDPDSLKEALYWEEVFSGHTLQNRTPFPGVQF